MFAVIPSGDVLSIVALLKLSVKIMNISGKWKVNDFAAFILMKAGIRISFPPLIKVKLYMFFFISVRLLIV